MDRLIYTLMNGAHQAQNSQAMLIHNLSNADTTGFRADLEKVQSSTVSGGTLETRVHVTQVEQLASFEPGPIISTGRDLDMAIADKGWFAVQNSEGQERYTRAGSFQLNALSQLVTPDGRLVLGDGGPINIPPAEKLEIALDGTIVVQPKGQGPEALATIGRLKLVNPPEAVMRKGIDGYFFRTDGQAQSAFDTNVRLVSKSLEGSNVNAVSTMVDVMTLSRKYQMSFKMMENV